PIGEALDPIRALFKALPASDQKTKIEAVYKSLLATQIEQRIPTIAPADYAGLLGDCIDADKTDGVLACQAECLIEKSGKLPEPKDRDQALQIIKGSPLQKAGAYGHYVRALVLASNPSSPPEAIGKELLTAFDTDDNALRTAHRRQRAARQLQ